MADNVNVTPGTGATIAADEIGGILYQRIKPTFGADGAAVDVSATNPFPIIQTATDFVVSTANSTTARQHNWLRQLHLQVQLRQLLINNHIVFY